MGTKTNDILIAIKGDIKHLDASMVTAQKKIDHLVKHTRKASRQMENPISKIGTYVKGYIGLQAGKWMLKLVGDIDSVKSSFNSLTSDVKGGSKGLLNDVKKAARGTVSELEIMRSTNLAISLMGKEVTGHLPKMMEVARVAARTQGASVQQMYNDIIVASGRQSVMILDNLGISSATAARYQEEYAKTLGKTRQQLNATEKRAGFFYAVMKAGNDLMDMAGGKALTMGERLQIVKAKAEDAAAGFAEKLTPGLEEFVTVLTETNDKMGNSLMNTMGDAVNDLLTLFSRLITQIKYMPEAYRQAWQDVKDTFSLNEGRRFAARWRSKQVEILNEWAEHDPSYAAKLMKKNWDLMKSYGFSEEYLTGGYRLLRGSSKYSKYRKPEKTTGSGGARPGSASSDAGGKGSGKKKDFSMSRYYSMSGQQKEAELAKLKESYQKYAEENKEYFLAHEEDMLLLFEQYRQKRLEIEEKYDAAAKAMKEGLANAAKSAMSSFESATKSALKSSLLGKEAGRNGEKPSRILWPVWLQTLSMPSQKL